MKPRKGLLLWVGALAVFLWASEGVGSGNGDSGEAGSQAEVSQPPLPLTMKGLHLEEFGEEGKGVDLWAAEARYSREDGKLYLDRVRILGVSREMKPSQPFELTGDSGVCDLDDRITVVNGNVRIVTQDGYTLSTDEVRYDYGTREIEGEGPVFMEGPEGSTEGIGLHVWMNEEVVVLRENVHTVIRPSALKRAKEQLQ
jgi:LPS export ABC transporter protein LptC